MKKTLNILVAGVLTLTWSTGYSRSISQSELTQAQQQSMTMTTTGVQPPPPPNYTQCTGQTNEAICRQAVDNQYANNVITYNQIKAQELAAQQARELQQRQYDGARQAAEDSRDQNKTASGAYGISQMLTQVVSTIAMAKFVASCGPQGCVNYPALALSIAMAIFSQQAGKQKQSHNTAGYNSCVLSNQVSTSQSNCGAPPGEFNYTGYPNNGPIDPGNLAGPDGKCIASAEICSQIESGLPPGTTLKDYQKGLSFFANGKAPFKANADGSVTDLKSGKTYTAKDFKDAASMAAAGMGAGDIALATNMTKGLGTGGIDVKKELANGGSLPNTEFEDAAARAAAAAAAGGNGNQNIDLDGFGKKRGIAAAEGLTKDFNGELIGVAGDDIWRMMNRRYRLKSAQDSFMSVPRP